MANEKNINSRIIHKHDSEANWNKAVNFIPIQGEIIVYDIDETYNYERVKIGDGIRKVNDLPFVDVQPDWDQNDRSAPDYVKNRPFYQDTVIDITWDGNTEGLDAVEGMPFYKVSGTTPEKNDILGSEIVFENDGVQEVYKVDNIGYMEGENCIAIGKFVVITYAENVTMAGIIFPTIGVWFLSLGTQFTRSLKKTILKTLDAKYLPDTVATKSDVEAVQTAADNAQTAADNAQTAANTANNTAENAKAIAENAKTIAENAVGADVVKGNYKLRIGQRKYAGYGFAILNGDSVQMNYTDTGIYDEISGSHLNMSGQSVFKESKSSQKKIVITTNHDSSTQENSIVLDGSNGQYLSISADGRLYYSGKALTVGSSPNFCKIIRGVNTPELEYDAATKGYVDGKISDTEIFLKSSTADSTKKFKITVDDSGKPTFTNSSDSADSYTPTDLPSVTTSDSGKFLRVSSAGEWVAETISNAEEASF